MLLLRSGDRAMISESAARPTAIIAVTTGSIGLQKTYFYTTDFALEHVGVFRDHLTFLCGRCVVRLFVPAPGLDGRP